jgi:hypothetical protein
MPIPDSEVLFDSGLGGGKPYLGSPAVVDQLLREALHRVTVLRREQLESGADPVPGILQIGADLQAVFYGADTRYQASAWNSPKHLGRMLVGQCGIGGDVSDAVARAATRMTRDFITDLVASEQGRMTEAEFQASTDALLLKFTQIFCRGR